MPELRKMSIGTSVYVAIDGTRGSFEDIKKQDYNYVKFQTAERLKKSDINMMMNLFGFFERDCEKVNSGASPGINFIRFLERQGKLSEDCTIEIIYKLSSARRNDLCVPWLEYSKKYCLSLPSESLVKVDKKYFERTPVCTSTHETSQKESEKDFMKTFDFSKIPMNKEYLGKLNEIHSLNKEECQLLVGVIKEDVKEYKDQIQKLDETLRRTIEKDIDVVFEDINKSQSEKRAAFKKKLRKRQKEMEEEELFYNNDPDELQES